MSDKKVAVYVRVSTDKQELKNQLQPLLDFVKKRGYAVYKVYQDIASGKNSDRKALAEMLKDAHQGRFDVIAVWALDRLSREGLSKTVNLIENLAKMKVDVISYSEPYLDTTNELARNILLAVLATLAKAERDKISERTKAGLERLRKQGVKLGRPSLDSKVRHRVLQSVMKGNGVKETARRLGVSVGFVSKLKNGVHKRVVQNEAFASV